MTKYRQGRKNKGEEPLVFLVIEHNLIKCVLTHAIIKSTLNLLDYQPSGSHGECVMRINIEWLSFMQLGQKKRKDEHWSEHTLVKFNSMHYLHLCVLSIVRPVRNNCHYKQRYVVSHWSYWPLEEKRRLEAARIVLSCCAAASGSVDTKMMIVNMPNTKPTSGLNYIVL